MRLFADSSGMTLAEVLVALGIVLTGLIALIAVAPLARLGVSASFLDLFEEATREFKWVVAHAPADSAEARSAGGWLSASARAPASPALPPEPNPDRASLSGGRGRRRRQAARPAQDLAQGHEGAGAGDGL